MGRLELRKKLVLAVLAEGCSSTTAKPYYTAALSRAVNSDLSSDEFNHFAFPFLETCRSILLINKPYLASLCLDLYLSQT
jgi:hypothetical protein